MPRRLKSLLTVLFVLSVGAAVATPIASAHPQPGPRTADAVEPPPVPLSVLDPRTDSTPPPVVLPPDDPGTTTTTTAPVVAPATNPDDPATTTTTAPVTTTAPATAPTTVVPPAVAMASRDGRRPVIVYVPGGAGLGFPTEEMFRAWAQPYVDQGAVVVMPHTDINVLPEVLDADHNGQVDDPTMLTALASFGLAYSPDMPLYDVLGDTALRSDPVNPVYTCNPYLHGDEEPTAYPLPTGNVPCWLFLPQYERTRVQIRDTVRWLGGAGADQLNIDPKRIVVVGESSGSTAALDLAFHDDGLPYRPALVITVAGSYPFAADLNFGDDHSPVVLFEFQQPDNPSIYQPADGLPVPDSEMVFDKIKEINGSGALVTLAGGGHLPQPGSDAAACVEAATTAAAFRARLTRPARTALLSVNPAPCADGAVSTLQRYYAHRVKRPST